ncbi:MAG: DegT/DnrJ/EryC1/StrS family aminotransferase [Actinomycetota bacterium]
MTEAGVPLFDPVAEHAEIGDGVEAAVLRVVRSGRFIGGPEVVAFEAEFGATIEGRAVAGCGSGTDALQLALVALGVGPGDEVVLPANTFTATAMAVEAIGGVPVVCDIDPDLYVMTADLVEPVLSRATRAIVPVHLYGHPAPMPELMALAEARGLGVLEDAAQAHGSSVDGRPSGAWGHAAAFSFYPSKNLGAYGDAGAVAGDPELVQRIRVLRDLGRDARGAHVEVARNSRLDAIQAAVLRTKLPLLTGWVERRRALAAGYRELLADLPLELPLVGPWAEHSYHLFVVRVPGDRDAIRRTLAAEGIEAGVHYPTPIHLQAAHAGRIKVPAGAPVAEAHAGRILSLPLYPQMNRKALVRVTDALRRALAA